MSPQASLDYCIALEGASASAVIADGADLRDVSTASVAAAATAALRATPSYAVYGTTLGTPSYATISKLIK
jgi:hypothetical protein